MASPRCPRDAPKVIQDGFKVVHAQMLWEFWAHPSCYKVLHWPAVHDAKCQCGSVRLYVHKTEALAGLWRALFSKRPENMKKDAKAHQEHQRFSHSAFYTRSEATAREGMRKLHAHLQEGSQKLEMVRALTVRLY